MKRRTAGVAVALLCTLLAAGCGRGRESWSGVRTVEDGDRLMVAAHVGLCGVVTLANISGRELTLQASRGNAVVGQARLAPRATIRVRFDWAGDLDGDVYFIDVVDPQRDEDLDFNSVLRVVRRTSWSDCPPDARHFAPLGMNVAHTGRMPGEHEHDERVIR